MLIADLPPVERPRERLASHGAGALADRELLALVLGTGGAPGSGAHHLAERLLARFGSAAALARAHPADLLGVPGVGSAKASAVAAAFELGRRAARAPAAAAIASSADVVTVVAPLLRGRSRERLALVVCDTANRVTACEVISEGSAERALVPVREVAVAVLRRDGRAFALAHNHPGGELTPSAADLDATRRIEEAARAVGLRFLDHLIVTDTGWCRVGSGSAVHPAAASTGVACPSPTPGRPSVGGPAGCARGVGRTGADLEPAGQSCWSQLMPAHGL